MNKRIAALTCVRNSPQFISKWISYYGHAFGYSNLYVVIDGLDQEVPSEHNEVNYIIVDHVVESRTRGDKTRAKRASDLASSLLKSYDIVVGCDVDEFLVVDPNISISLASYLSEIYFSRAIAALGIDIVQHPTEEAGLDWDGLYLTQRKYGVISDRYTKVNVINDHVEWGSGFHRVRGMKAKIDPNLYLLHAGSIDSSELEKRSHDKDRLAMGWKNHQMRRNAVNEELRNAIALNGDERFNSARKELSRFRSIISWNKPKPLKKDKVIVIPDRFKALI